MRDRRLLGIGGVGVATVASAAALALPGVASAARSVVTFDIAADLEAGDAGDEIAGSSTRYRCDSSLKLTDRIWFERRTGSDGAWQRIEPDQVRYSMSRFPDQRRADGRVRRASVQAPRSSFAGAGADADEFRLSSRMTFSCAGHIVVARSETLPLPGLGA